MSSDRVMKKEDVIHIHDGILLSHKKEQNSAIYRVVDGPRDSERVKNSEKQIFIILFICGIQKNDIDELICKADIDTQMQRRSIWIPREQFRVDEVGDWD